MLKKAIKILESPRFAGRVIPTFGLIGGIYGMNVCITTRLKKYDFGDFIELMAYANTGGFIGLCIGGIVSSRIILFLAPSAIASGCVICYKKMN
jgi:hypothetical protein